MFPDHQLTGRKGVSQGIYTELEYWSLQSFSEDFGGAPGWYDTVDHVRVGHVRSVLSRDCHKQPSENVGDYLKGGFGHSSS